MGELQFAKSFLTTVDSKSTKYQPDHIFDPKTFATRVPYALPKLSSPPHPPPPTSGPAPPPPPGAEAAPQSLTLTLKSSRNPAMTLTLTSIPPSTLISDLKSQVHSHLGGSTVVDISKIKILSNKKPIPPSKKTVAEVMADNPSPSSGPTLELGVMVMGGAPEPPPSEPMNLFAASQQQPEQAAAAPASSSPMEGIEKTRSPPAVQPGEASGAAVLATSEFWTDLQGFLEQRLKDADEAKRLAGVFKKAWESGKAKP